MKEYPILFNGEMVRAILDGRKTQTRRVVKHPTIEHVVRVNSYRGKTEFDLIMDNEIGTIVSCPYGVPGDLLWVRETWQGLVSVYDEDLPWSHVAVMHKRRENVVEIGYKADYPNPIDDGGWAVWVPSIHMPRWASRITLRVTDVRVERVQEISHDDATAEGLTQWTHESSGTIHYGITHADVWEKDPRQTFQRLWDSINAARGHGWDVNPWVWVVSFERVTP